MVEAVINKAVAVFTGEFNVAKFVVVPKYLHNVEDFFMFVIV